MLSLWPTLFDYQFFAPTILRGGLALALILTAWQRFILTRQNLLEKKHFWFSGLEILLTIFLLLGYLTQPAALLVALWSISQIKKQPISGLLAITVALCLLLLGPGALAIDLPL